MTSIYTEANTSYDVQLRTQLSDFAVRPTLDTMRTTFGQLQDLLLIGVWIQYATDARWQQPNVHATAERSIRTEIAVARVSYNSPLEIVVAIPSFTGSCFAAARGSIYLLKKWQEYRKEKAEATVKEAEADLHVAALHLAQSLLPTRDEYLQRALAREPEQYADDLEPLLPFESRVVSATNILNQISAMRIEQV